MSVMDRRQRLASVVGGVLRQAVADFSAAGILVLEPDSPEGALAIAWAAAALGEERVHRPQPPPRLEIGGTAEEAAEFARAAARVVAREREWLLAHPANKTALVLAREVPPEALLPLGDLYATQVYELAGGCTLPADVLPLAHAAGGPAVLDRALTAWLEERRPLEHAVALLPAAARPLVRERLLRNRAARRWPRRIPGLSGRTLWLDVFS
jgi:hypothetical protein